MDVRELPLGQAVERWCEPTLVNQVKVWECQVPEYKLQESEFVRFVPPPAHSWLNNRLWIQDTDTRRWSVAWTDLTNDLRRRIKVGEIFLRGVQTQPERRIVEEQIPASWAIDMEFDFRKEAATVDAYRYTGVICSLDPPPAGNRSVDATDPVVARLRSNGVSSLSDDEILGLLEEHARRVVDGPDAKLIAPGKISLMPIIRRKLIARADEGAIMASKGAECRYLAHWIAEKVTHFATPKEGTISKMLGKDYEVEKARSNAEIQKSNI